MALSTTDISKEFELPNLRCCYKNKKYKIPCSLHYGKVVAKLKDLIPDKEKNWIVPLLHRYKAAEIINDFVRNPPIPKYKNMFCKIHANINQNNLLKTNIIPNQEMSCKPFIFFVENNFIIPWEDKIKSSPAFNDDGTLDESLTFWNLVSSTIMYLTNLPVSEKLKTMIHAKLIESYITEDKKFW